MLRRSCMQMRWLYKLCLVVLFRGATQRNITVLQTLSLIACTPLAIWQGQPSSSRQPAYSWGPFLPILCNNVHLQSSGLKVEKFYFFHLNSLVYVFQIYNCSTKVKYSLIFNKSVYSKILYTIENPLLPAERITICLFKNFTYICLERIQPHVVHSVLLPPPHPEP